jgi:hypothetical protein
VVQIDKLRADRRRVLETIYGVSMGSGTTTVAGSQLLADLGLSDRELADACDWLEGEGLIQAVRTIWGHATPYIVLITHHGIRQIEQDGDDTSAKEVEKRRADRLRVLKTIYDLSVGGETTTVAGSRLLADLGLSDRELADACDWLEDERLIKSVRVSWGYLTPFNIQITHRGIKEMEQGSDKAPIADKVPIVTAQIGIEDLTRLIQITEQGFEEIKKAMQAPRQATENFPAINLTYIEGGVSGSTIQSGSPGAHQEISAGNLDLNPIREFLRQFDASADELDLPADEAAVLAADIDTLKAQVGSPKPKRHIIKESLNSVRAILEITSGSAAAIGLLDLLQHIHL